MAARILIAESDPALLTTLEHNLAGEGYSVATATSSTEAVDFVRSEPPELIILDLPHPGKHPLEACRMLRQNTIAPIIMLMPGTEAVDEESRFKAGADACINKPLTRRKLLALVKAQLRRSAVVRVARIGRVAVQRIGELEIDAARHRVSCRNSPLCLTPKEFDLLVFLAIKRGTVVSREELLEKVWGYNSAGYTRTVDVHIRWLRSKIEADPSNPRYLLTVRGAGYIMEG